jgi:hypothetical protein
MGRRRLKPWTRAHRTEDSAVPTWHFNYSTMKRLASGSQRVPSFTTHDQLHANRQTGRNEYRRAAFAGDPARTGCVYGVPAKRHVYLGSSNKPSVHGVKACDYGFHSCESMRDAHLYAPDTRWLARTKAWGDIDVHEDKIASQYIQYCWFVDFNSLMRTVCLDAAEQAIRSMNPRGDLPEWIAQRLYDRDDDHTLLDMTFMQGGMDICRAIGMSQARRDKATAFRVIMTDGRTKEEVNKIKFDRLMPRILYAILNGVTGDGYARQGPGLVETLTALMSGRLWSTDGDCKHAWGIIERAANDAEKHYFHYFDE